MTPSRFIVAFVKAILFIAAAAALIVYGVPWLLVTGFHDKPGEGALMALVFVWYGYVFIAYGLPLIVLIWTLFTALDAYRLGRSMAWLPFIYLLPGLGALTYTFAGDTTSTKLRNKGAVWVSIVGITLSFQVTLYAYVFLKGDYLSKFAAKTPVSQAATDVKKVHHH
jgi:hypothetical protein